MYTTVENIQHSIETGLRKRRYFGLNRRPVPVRCIEDNLESSSLLDCVKYYGGNAQNLSKSIQYGKKYKGKNIHKD